MEATQPNDIDRIEMLELVSEIARYLDAVELFRVEGCDPAGLTPRRRSGCGRWRPGSRSADSRAALTAIARVV